VGLKTADCGYSHLSLGSGVGPLFSTGHVVPRLCYAAFFGIVFVFFLVWTHSILRANADSELANFLLLGRCYVRGALCSGHQFSINVGPLLQNVPTVCMFG
jgi:hypothetical protein